MTHRYMLLWAARHARTSRLLLTWSAIAASLILLFHHADRDNIWASLEGSAQYMTTIREWHTYQPHWGPIHLFDGLKDFGDHSPRDERPCREWNPEADEALDNPKCWRAVRYRQLESFLATQNPRDFFSGSPARIERNIKALTRLKGCLGGKLPESACPRSVYNVILGSYKYFDETYVKGDGIPSGEIIWVSTYLEAAEEMGVTLLNTPAYDSMIDLHRQLPNVIDVIWAADNFVIACQNDPRCVAGMRPTRDMYPDLNWSNPGEPKFENHTPFKASKTPSKWVFSQQELDAIPPEKKGTIPAWKLFAFTFWGNMPGNNYYDVPEGFTFNSLGPQWTIGPFQYPNSTWLPFSIENDCLAAPDVKQEDKENRMFILGKRINFIYSNRAPDPRSWNSLLDEVGGGIEAFMAVGDQDLAENPDTPWPQGIHNLGRMDPMEFQVAVGKSKLMLGIGWPLISPSPYDSICQGTPVIIPTFRDVEEGDPWDRFRSAYSQHGPVLDLGPPYAYPYRAGDRDDLIAKLKMAVSTPISR